MKVLVNGCSHLAGTELHEEDSVRIKLTWPNFINNWQVFNISRPASSNDSITRRTIDALQAGSYDMVYVQWSYFNRIELQIPDFLQHGCQYDWFCINGQNAQIKGNLNNNPDFVYNLARSVYLKQFDNQWFENYNLSSMIVLQQYLIQNKIPYWFGLTTRNNIDFSSARGKLLRSEKFVPITWEEFCEKNKFKKIIIHYEQQAHGAYAEYIESLNLSKDML